jgi:hypothetical protein
MNIFQTRLELLATQLLDASDTGKDTSAILAKIEEVKHYNELLGNATTPTPKKHTAQAAKEQRGRKEYSEEEVIKNNKELAVSIEYTPYINKIAQPKVRAEFILLGKVKDGRNGSNGFLTALRACEDTADIKSGNIYSFRNSTLNSMEILGN